jgi:hypothetical protein
MKNIFSRTSPASGSPSNPHVHLSTLRFCGCLFFGSVFRKKVFKKVQIFFLPLMFLTGCTPYTTEFRCPIGQGLPCHSMTQVHSSLAGVLAGQAVQEGMNPSSQLYLPPQSAPLIEKEPFES